MAILPQGCPGIRVTIMSNGQALNEYPDEENEFVQDKFKAPRDRIAVNYVECITNATFEIKFEVLPGFIFRPDHRNVSFWARVDGTEIGGWTASGYYSQFLSAAYKRVSATEMSTRALRFSPIHKVDDVDSGRVKEDIKLADGLGEIVVHVHRSNQKEVPGWDVAPGASSVGKEVTEISEKALKGKAISHGIAYGPEHRQYRPRDHEYHYPDGYYTPMALFVFRYRSRDDLQQELVIPRSPSPEAIVLPALRSDAARSNQARLASLKKEIQRIKAEEAEEADGDDDNGRPQNRKRGPDSEIPQNDRPYKTSRSRDGKLVIDLTDD